MFEIKSIIDTSSAEVALKHPVTGAPLGATITMAGPEHPTRKAAEFAKQRKLRQSFQKSGKLELTDPVDDELDAIDKLTRCTLGWNGITDGGVVVEFSTEAAAKLYASEGLGWLREQLLLAMGERERFIKACAQI